MDTTNMVRNIGILNAKDYFNFLSLFYANKIAADADNLIENVKNQYFNELSCTIRIDGFMTDKMISQKNRIEEYVKKANFKGYQKIILPYGIEINGVDYQDVADLIFSENLSGKSVLDVGCNYGFFCHEAKRRNAGKSVGY